MSHIYIGCPELGDKIFSTLNIAASVGSVFTTFASPSDHPYTMNVFPAWIKMKISYKFNWHCEEFQFYHYADWSSLVHRYDIIHSHRCESEDVCFISIMTAIQGCQALLSSLSLIVEYNEKTSTTKSVLAINEFIFLGKRNCLPVPLNPSTSILRGAECLSTTSTALPVVHAAAPITSSR